MSPTPPLYFKVGQPVTDEQLRALSWEQMQQRSLNDPAFAGCAPKFDWRKYLEMDFDDTALQKEVEATLDQFATTPEGQHTIRQAYAMQNHRILQGETDYPPYPRMKLAIGDRTNLLQTSFIPGLNYINITRHEIDTRSYLAMDGNYYHFTIPHLLYHEMGHAKDGAGDTIVRRYRVDIRGNEYLAAKEAIRVTANGKPEDDPRMQALRAKYFSIEEYPVILDSNAFMTKYYGEHPRALNHSDGRDTGWFNELIGRTKPQPHQEEDTSYSYPALPLPSVQACSAPLSSAKTRP